MQRGPGGGVAFVPEAGCRATSGWHGHPFSYSVLARPSIPVIRRPLADEPA
jgi:hypothetical protein